jgi:hypothetical protein
MFSVIILLSIECYLLSDCLGLVAFLTSGDWMFPPTTLLTSVLLGNCCRFWLLLLPDAVPLVGDGGGLPMDASRVIVSRGLLVGTAGLRELMIGTGVGGPGVRFRLRREVVMV